MFKKTVFPVILCALLCIIRAGAAEPLFNGTLRDHQRGVEVTCWYEAGDPDAANVDSAVCAVYDGRGRLLSVAALDAKKNTQTVVIPCETSDVDHVKLMAMDADRKPLRPVQTLKPTPESSEAPQFLNDPVISTNSVSVTGTPTVYARVTADRNCRLYWALYKHDAGHPTADRFKSGDLPGSDAHGMRPMSASQPNEFPLNNLSDQTDYDLWLWLTNTDFSASSYMRLLTFRTVDATPPTFLSHPTPQTVRERSATLLYSVSENATVYWVVVEDGNRFPNPPTGGGSITKDYAIKQVIGGNGGISHGNAQVNANASATIQLSNLTPEKSYHVWYVAKDNAGNYSEFRVGNPDTAGASDNPRGVCMLTVSTLDKQPPSVSVEATNYPDGSPETPYADSGVRLIFSEGIRRFSTGEVLSDVYDAIKTARNDTARDAAKETLAAFLRETVILQTGWGSVYHNVAERRDGTESEWTIDYRNAEVSWEDGSLVLYFPSTDDRNGESALRLLGGQTYSFLLQDISDLSENLNQIKSQRTSALNTMPAQILLKEMTLSAANYPAGVSDIDLAFTATPVAVSRADGDAAWDLLFWSDTTCVFEVYRRSHLSTSVVYDQSWAKVQNPGGNGGRGTVMLPVNATGFSGQSMHMNLCQYTGGAIPSLRTLEDGRVYEYAVRFLEVDGDTERKLWDSEVQFGVSAVAGSASSLLNLSAGLTEERFNTAKSSGSVYEIGSPSPFLMARSFYATAAPSFTNGAPTFIPSDTSVSMWFQMTRPGTVHYLLAPAGGTISAADTLGRTVDWSRYLEIPESGADTRLTPFNVQQPGQYNILQQRFSGTGVRTGSAAVDSKGTSVTVTGLKSETNYFAYFVLQGVGSTVSTYAQLFRFTTADAAPPSVRLNSQNPVTEISVDRAAVVDYLIVDTDSKIIDPLLYNVFWNNPPSGGRQPMSSYVQVSSVLEAMRMDTGNGSLFDVYATKDYKDRVAAYIRQGLANGGSVIGVGKGINVQPGAPLRVDASTLNMIENHEYALVCVAQGVEGGANVFRSAYPITPPDSNPLLVTGVETVLNVDDGGERTQAPTFTGTVELTFDGNLYYFDGGVIKAVDLGPHFHSTRDTDKYTPLWDYASATPSGQMEVYTRIAQVNHTTSSVTINLNKAANNARITFPTKLCDEYGNMHTGTLTVTLNVATTPNGYDSARNPLYSHVANIEISPAWDGR